MNIQQLCELDPTQVRVNQPLQWDVFSAQGKLLLHKGSVINSEGQRDKLIELGVYAKKTDIQKPARVEARVRVYDPFYEWDDMRGRLVRLNLAFMQLAHAPRQAPELVAELDHIVDRMMTLVVKVPDIAIFQIMQMEMTNYVVAHHLQAVALTALIAQKIEWGAQMTRTACRAALTMNIAMLELQTVLTAQTQPITPEQQEAIRAHGATGRQLLQAMGVTDPDWLRAVDEHHPDRLPKDRLASQLAVLVHHVDIYLAKISPRAYRVAKTPNAAARELLQDTHVDRSLVSILIKVVGIYPPGTHVKLSNGETAVVVRRGEHAHTPRVCSLTSAEGMPLGEPAARDTTQSRYAVVSIIPKSKVMVVFDRAKLFQMVGTGGVTLSLQPG
jgi:hypothetical protein